MRYGMIVSYSLKIAFVMMMMMVMMNQSIPFSCSSNGCRKGCSLWTENRSVMKEGWNDNDVRRIEGRWNIKQITYLVIATASSTSSASPPSPSSSGLTKNTKRNHTPRQAMAKIVLQVGRCMCYMIIKVR